MAPVHPPWTVTGKHLSVGYRGFVHITNQINSFPLNPLLLTTPSKTPFENIEGKGKIASNPDF